MSELSPKTKASIEKDWAVMRKNFGKISSWFKSGTDSKYPLPPVITEWLEEYGKLQELVGKLSSGYNSQNKVIKSLKDKLASAEKAEADAAEARGYLNKRIEALEKSLKGLEQQIDALDSPAGLTPDPAKDDEDAKAKADKAKADKAKADKAKADKAKADKAKKESTAEIDLTAEAIDAGDVSPEAIEALDNMAEGLQADLDDLDEL